MPERTFSEDELREAARQIGKRGGRPRSVVHKGGAVPAVGCRCAECRAARGWKDGRDYK